MNRPTRAGVVLAVTAVLVVACGRVPEPAAPSASDGGSSSGVVTSAASTLQAPTTSALGLTSSSGTTSRSVAPLTTTPRSSKAADTTTAVTEKPPEPPKPPDRWVLGSADRRSLEQQIGTSFTNFSVDDFYRRVCPAHDVCVHNAFREEPSLGHADEDCWVGRNEIPDPLAEGGTVTWVVNNLCDPA
ncbi:hypothetical protein [Amycolatopsis sp. NBC_01286]|uniref:hypothetical protein n=1 Tax=Amycolatopsis sp. NBC_01286 TaxID=2903560 RepID=UPI002E1416F4|nr:hypothetical protein OG570_23405 [Amycolatopsis sp. NBC_01286]